MLDAGRLTLALLVMQLKHLLPRLLSLQTDYQFPGAHTAVGEDLLGRADDVGGNGPSFSTDDLDPQVPRLSQAQEKLMAATLAGYAMAGSVHFAPLMPPSTGSNHRAAIKARQQGCERSSADPWRQLTSCSHPEQDAQKGL